MKKRTNDTRIVLKTTLFLSLFFLITGSTCISPELSQSGKIVFLKSSTRSDLYLINTDGSNKKLITASTTLITSCSFSPDGSKIVFIEHNQIFTINADGSNIKQLTFGGDDKKKATFTPDGKKIVFLQYVGVSGQKDIFIIDIHGKNEKRLTNENKSMSSLSVSPDGSNIIFSGLTHGDIYRINIDGSGLKRLTFDSTTNSQIRYCSYSPDGSKIIIVKDVDPTMSQMWNICIINADGTNRIHLPTSSFVETPSFSPDGNKIVFVLGQHATREIYTMNIDGSNLKQLTDNSLADTDPSYAGKPR